MMTGSFSPSVTPTVARYLRLGTVAIAAAVLVFLSHQFAREAGRVASIWPLNAFVLAVLMRYPPAGWTQVLVVALGANIAVNFAMQDAPLPAILLSLANAVETYVCARLLHRRDSRFDITHSAHLVRFAVVAGIIGPVLSAALASIVLAGAQPVTETFVAWYIADALGMLIFAPALLVFGAVSSEKQAGPSLIVVVTGLGLLLLTLFGVFAQNQYPLLFLVPPVLALATFKVGIKGAATGIIITAIVAISFTVAGLGPAMLVQGSGMDRVNLLQAFLAIISLTTLPIAAALAERARPHCAGRSQEPGRDRHGARTGERSALSHASRVLDRHRHTVW